MDPSTLSLPTLMRAARARYGSVTRAALSEAGYDDLPRTGPFVLGAIAGRGASLGAVIQALSVSKQAAGVLVDTLVGRGYLVREVEPGDRRRLRVSLTTRGADAARVVGAAIDTVDAELVARVGPEHVAHTRATLIALIADE